MNIRGKFSITPEQSLHLLKQAVSDKIPGCMVLSTCNRTEIYGLSHDPNQLIELLCTPIKGLKRDFLKHGYVYQGITAIEHLFKVASGLDSQLIGDYEILSQIKQSAKIAKENGCINSFMERAINYALQVSKEIKTKTKISTGTVSVSYAAIEIIKERVSDLENKKILLVGTGKFGNHITKNLKNYLPDTIISFTNRTNNKALELAKQYDGEFIPYKNISSAANEADIIIVSSASESYTVYPSFFITGKPRLILDLSVPQNVHPDTKNLQGITLLNVDEVSSILDKTILTRKEEIPKAIQIIDDTLNSMEDWHRHQSNNPLLRLVKSQLHQISEHFSNGENIDSEKIHKTVSSLAIQLKDKRDKGCQCINALSSYLQMDYETSS